MDKFWRLFEESVIVQACIALAMVITICTMVLLGKEIPDLMTNALMLVLGFYFGSKSEQRVRAWQEGIRAMLVGRPHPAPGEDKK